MNIFLICWTASDYGLKLPILRSNPEDQILYQTERYNEDSFGYEIPIREEGEYVLVLKFAEVYFAQSQQKVRVSFSLPVPSSHRRDYLPWHCLGVQHSVTAHMFAFYCLQVFDVRVNGHTVVKDLDIFDRVGHSTAHDEIIPIVIRKGKLSVQGEVSTFTGKLNVEFVKVTNKIYYSSPPPLLFFFFLL